MLPRIEAEQDHPARQPALQREEVRRRESLLEAGHRDPPAELLRARRSREAGGDPGEPMQARSDQSLRDGLRELAVAHRGDAAVGARAVERDGRLLLADGQEIEDEVCGEAECGDGQEKE